jgi:hypothetical protein
MEDAPWTRLTSGTVQCCGLHQGQYRNGWPTDVTAQPLELLALTRPRCYAGVQRKPGDHTDPVIEWLVTRRQRL